MAGYLLTAAAYLASGVEALGRMGPLSPTFSHCAGGYLVPPATLSVVLAGAARSDRLGSDMYKRLNLAMLQSGLLGLGSIALTTAGWDEPRTKLNAAAFALAVINSTKGWAYGVLGWDKKGTETTLLGDAIDGTKSTAKGLLSIPKNVSSALYLAATGLVGSLQFVKLSQITRHILANSVTRGGGLAPLLARYNRLSLLTLVLYTLKDAADRDRLGGTTFVQLNVLAALSLGINYVFYSTVLPRVVGASSATLSAFCALNGLAWYMKNQRAS